MAGGFDRESAVAGRDRALDHERRRGGIGFRERPACRGDTRRPVGDAPLLGHRSRRIAGDLDEAPRRDALLEPDLGVAVDVAVEGRGAVDDGADLGPGREGEQDGVAGVALDSEDVGAVRIGADLVQHRLPVDPEAVVARAAEIDALDAGDAPREIERETGAGHRQRVAAAAAIDAEEAGIGHRDEVVAAAAEDRVGTAAAHEPVVGAIAGERLGKARADDVLDIGHGVRIAADDECVAGEVDRYGLPELREVQRVDAVAAIDAVAGDRHRAGAGGLDGKADRVVAVAAVQHIVGDRHGVGAGRAVAAGVGAIAGPEVVIVVAHRRAGWIAGTSAGPTGTAAAGIDRGRQQDGIVAGPAVDGVAGNDHRGVATHAADAAISGIIVPLVGDRGVPLGENGGRAVDDLGVVGVVVVIEVFLVACHATGPTGAGIAARRGAVQGDGVVSGSAVDGHALDGDMRIATHATIAGVAGIGAAARTAALAAPAAAATGRHGRHGDRVDAGSAGQGSTIDGRLRVAASSARAATTAIAAGAAIVDVVGTAVVNSRRIVSVVIDVVVTLGRSAVPAGPAVGAVAAQGAGGEGQPIAAALRVDRVVGQVGGGPATGAAVAALTAGAAVGIHKYIEVRIAAAVGRIARGVVGKLPVEAVGRQATDAAAAAVRRGVIGEGVVIARAGQAVAVVGGLGIRAAAAGATGGAIPGERTRCAVRTARARAGGADAGHDRRGAGTRDGDLDGAVDRAAFAIA